MHVVRRDVIGVVCTQRQEHVVREFFELFKTPWDLWEPGRRYDVVIVSGATMPRLVDPRLTVVFGAQETECESSLGLDAIASPHVSSVMLAGQEVPIYGDCVTFGNGNVVVEMADDRATTVRCGYDLFAEVEFLLTKG